MNPKNARLFCQTGALAGTNIDITKDILIGRQPSCDLVVYPHTVSGKHARIFFKQDEGAYYVEDLGSSNGTWVDRVRVNKPVRLDTLSVITLAKDIDFIFQVVDLSKIAPKPSFSGGKTQKKKPSRQHTVYQESFAPPPELDPPTLPSKPPQPDRKSTIYESTFSPPPDLDQHTLDQSKEKTFQREAPSRIPHSDPPLQKTSTKLVLVVTTKGKEEQFTLKPGKMTIGRSSSCDITIVDPFMSSKHASLQLSSSAIILEDLGSSNKTYINGKAINRAIKLSPDMSIRFGPNSEAKIVKR